jgi:hypothetical protein
LVQDLIGIETLVIGNHIIMILQLLIQKELKIKISLLEYHLDQQENYHSYMLKMELKYISHKLMECYFHSVGMLTLIGNMVNQILFIKKYIKLILYYSNKCFTKRLIRWKRENINHIMG